jgi:hypothetical protein
MLQKLRSKVLCGAPPPTQSYVLYVILPYFNYCAFERRRELFIQFVERIAKEPHIKIVLSEAIYPGTATSAQLPVMNGVWKHLRFTVPMQLWVKESLINRAACELPTDWNYMAWIDADISFLMDDWVQQSMKALDKDDVVQLFQTCVNLGPDEEALKIDRSLGFMHRESGQKLHKTDKYGHWHPGYAWACTRKAYEQMGGLLDIGILGSGDRHMAMAILGHADWSVPGNIHPNYLIVLKKFQARASGLTIGYLKCTILHYWHGRFEDRKYRERWDILTKSKYDPLTDVQYDANGVITFTAAGVRLVEDIKEYFMGRKEDNKSTK